MIATMSPRPLILSALESECRIDGGQTGVEVVNLIDEVWIRSLNSC